MVTYKIDLLENEIDFENVLNYDISKLEEIISKYSQNNTNNFGIKIVDNFQCYLLTKEKEDENAEYIKEGKNYQIKLSNKSSDEPLVASLVKSLKSDGYIYNIFSVSNNIENIVDVREIGAEIIWTKKEGLVVPLNAITKKNNISYVTLVSKGEYIEVPIKEVISNDTICVVENYSNEELTNLNISSEGIIERYDQLVINEER